MLVPKDIIWHENAQVVIIGFGLAGAVATIAAWDSGVDVVILEKQPKNALYSNSSMSGGVFVCPTNYDQAVRHMAALCQMYPDVQWTDLETIKAWAKYSIQNKDWLVNLGAPVKFFKKGAEYPQLPGSDSIEVWQFPGRGLGMMNFMYDNISSRNIKAYYQIKAEKLLTDEEGKVIGIKASTGDEEKKEIYIRATKAVILCCGGFEHNEEMKLQYLRVYPMYFSGGLANTGDGIRMTQEVGADLWHMNCVSARLVAKFPDLSVSCTLDFMKNGKYGFIIVDRYGRRYMSENIKMHGASYELTAFDSHKLEHPRVPSYAIFDQRRMNGGSLAWRNSGPSGPVQLYHWSQDNSTELEHGWIDSGETISQLAKKIGIESNELEITVERWNSLCRNGQDSDFAREITDLVPLNLPPYYAIKLFPGGPNTQGGPRRNDKAQVVSPFGNPIPHLYAAGECGSVYGMLYPAGGGNLADCIAFGRIAAENAVKEDVI